jgi:hypothetical protein
MAMSNRIGWSLLFAAIALGCGVLSLYRADAAPRDAPFASAIEQRMESVAELREIRALLKEQNALLKEQMTLLRSGEVRVLIVGLEKRAAKPGDQELQEN